MDLAQGLRCQAQGATKRSYEHRLYRSGHRLGRGTPVQIVRFERPQLDGEHPIIG